jgi:osmotically inducible protein OsmC
MALSHALAQAGNAPDELQTSSTVTFQPGTGITKIALAVDGRVQGIDAEAFQQAAQTPRRTAPSRRRSRACPR